MKAWFALCGSILYGCEGARLARSVFRTMAKQLASNHAVAIEGCKGIAAGVQFDPPAQYLLDASEAAVLSSRT